MASQGPLSPATIQDNDSTGANTWNFPERAKSADGSFATVDLSLNGVSHYLLASNFGFTIPASATINGILVEILRQEDSPLDNVFDNAVRIVKGGAVGSSDKSSTTEWNVNETNYVSYGGATDLWGLSWTEADINLSSFGIALSAKSVNGLVFTDGEVDHIRITVYYTATATTTSTSTSTTTSTSTSTSTTTTILTTTSTSTSTTSTSTSTTSTSSSTTTTTSTSTSSSTSTSTSSTSTSTSTTSTSSSTTSSSTSTTSTSSSTSTTSTSTSTTRTTTSTTTTYPYPARFSASATKQA